MFSLPLEPEYNVTNPANGLSEHVIGYFLCNLIFRSSGMDKFFHLKVARWSLVMWVYGKIIILFFLFQSWNLTWIIWSMKIHFIWYDKEDVNQKERMRWIRNICQSKCAESHCCLMVKQHKMFKINLGFGSSTPKEYFNCLFICLFMINSQQYTYSTRPQVIKRQLSI